MALSEFELIERYFRARDGRRPEVRVGIGDDGAVIAPPAEADLVVALDTLIAGVHFPENTSPFDIGWKALAVNLSDLAAMGAEPAWFTLALTLPEADEAWLAAFSEGLFELAGRWNIALVGGDTTRGPLTVSVQIAGQVPRGEALLRAGARPGDGLWVSGTLGDAALALQDILSGTEPDPAQRLRLDRPEPRLATGMGLRGLARCAIDISDGLLADIAHLLAASPGTGALILQDSIPLSTATRARVEALPVHWKSVLDGGDDYELCFCVPPEREAEVGELAERTGEALTRIGTILDTPGLWLESLDGHRQAVTPHGYTHFDHERAAP